MPAKALAAKAANYAELRQDYFFSEKKELCSLCDDLERCAVCPVMAALATGTLAVIPELDLPHQEGSGPRRRPAWTRRPQLNLP